MQHYLLYYIYLNCASVTQKISKYCTLAKNNYMLYYIIGEFETILTLAEYLMLYARKIKKTTGESKYFETYEKSTSGYD